MKPLKPISKILTLDVSVFRNSNNGQIFLSLPKKKLKKTKLKNLFSGDIKTLKIHLDI